MEPWLAFAGSAVGLLVLGCCVLFGRRRASDPLHPVAIGDVAPNVRLPTWAGDREFDLESERGGYVVLAFLLGDWCPMCHIMLRSLSRNASTLSDHGARLVVVVPASEGFEAADDASFVVLSDPGSRAAKMYTNIDVATRAGRDTSWPEAFLIDPDGVIQFGSRLESNGRGRAPEAVIALLRGAHDTLLAAV